MDRRIFLGALAGLPLAAASGHAQTRAPFVDYVPGRLEALLAAGRTVFLDYSAVWCTTCAAQERVIHKLLADNPAYEKAMVFMRVDWDEYGQKPVARDRRIVRRSTHLVIRGDRELGRVVALTSLGDIKALMDRGLPAA